MKFQFSLKSVLVAVAAVSVLLAICREEVTETDLSLSTFRMRSRTYYRYPFFPYSRGGHVSASHETEFSLYLAENGFVAPETEEIWTLNYLLTEGWFYREGDYGPSGRLWRDFGRTEGPHDWIEWSKVNPQCAAILWPRVLLLARELDPGSLHFYIDYLADEIRIDRRQPMNTNGFRQLLAEWEAGFGAIESLPSGWKKLSPEGAIGE